MKSDSTSKELAYYWYHIYLDKFTSEQLSRNEKRSLELASIEDYIISKWGFIEQYNFIRKMELRLECSSYYHDLDYAKHLEVITNLSVFKEQYDKKRNVYITSNERKEGTTLIQLTPSIYQFVSAYNIYRNLKNRIKGNRKIFGDIYYNRVNKTLLEFKTIDHSIIPPLSQNPFINKIVKKSKPKDAVAKESNFEDWRITINPGSRTFTCTNVKTCKQLRSVQFDDLGFKENKSKENIHVDYLRHLAFLQNSLVADDYLAYGQQILNIEDSFKNIGKKRRDIQKAFRKKLNIAESSKMFEKSEFNVEKEKLSYYKCVCDLKLPELYIKKGEYAAKILLDRNLNVSRKGYDKEMFREFQKHLDLIENTVVFQTMIDDFKVHAKYIKQKREASEINHFDDDIQVYLNLAEDEIANRQSITSDLVGNLPVHLNPHDPNQ